MKAGPSHSHQTDHSFAGTAAQMEKTSPASLHQLAEGIDADVQPADNGMHTLSPDEDRRSRTYHS